MLVSLHLGIADPALQSCTFSLPPGLHVQEGAHDSVEDARTAMLLYRKYCELEAHNAVSDSLHKLYESGRSLGWQVPAS